MAKLSIIVGSKNYSSWSLRAWLALEQTGAPFDEVVIALDRPETKGEIARHSPSGRVPALHDGERVVWDSLAIAEYLAERFPEAGLWPADENARAIARAVSAEMHSGFSALRQNMPMNMRASAPGRGRAPGVDEDLARIFAIWRECRERFGAGGPFLFGRRSIADAMYAPVVSRLTTYGVALDETAAAYSRAIWELPAMQRWLAASRLEPAASKYELA
ncbi:MAG TPA: glutathione S-transferase family protein [Polyangia bacterium]